MTEALALDAYGVLTEPATLRIQRLLPGPIERVWSYLTESELRRKWLASGDMELKQGAAVELVWRNDDLTNPPGQRPPDFPADHRMVCHITEVDPPRKLAITWGRSGGVTFNLENAGNRVLLTVTHRRLPDRQTMLMVSAGWHMHLDVLAARLEGGTPSPFWDGWRRLREDYDRRLPV